MLTMLISVFTVITVYVTMMAGGSLNCSVSVSATEMPPITAKAQIPTFRASFFTSFAKSSEARKNNIKLAARSLNNVMVGANEEFSFNKTVGDRTEKRGYQTAKIIVAGKFVEGVGGGVCQVSTTLYNAVLLAGLKVSEYHAHSLPVNYVAPSFDAMVNSGSSDLRFINDTHSPVIIKTHINGERLCVEIYGEKTNARYERVSEITGEIEPPTEQVIVDVNGEYPDVFKGERKVICYGKKGYTSRGKIRKIVNGKVVWEKVIRSDLYNAQRAVIVEGTAERKEMPLAGNDFMPTALIRR